MFLFLVVPQQFLLEPLNLTTLQGSDAQFNATVEGTWKIMTWFVKDCFVLNVPVIGNVTSSSERYSAQFCTPGETNCVQFNIHNVTRELSGPVTCTVLGEYGSEVAQLSVQGEEGNTDICESF